ncbi:TetR/AcrR family transcriptional regulator [Streptomyces sp. NPDC101118]|uniref:TetR/AcrR family transcriptional regulator n=1 Tax=Streptomyces sp. NPDC101118 TaxID=3366109 RepID=UPI0037F654F9
MSTTSARGPADGPAPARPGTDRRTLIADAAIATVAAAGLRGLTHRAVDTAAGLPAGSTSYYFRTRTALLGACFERLAELDLSDFDARDGAPPPAVPAGPAEAADLMADVLHRWLTTGRERQLARYELSLEAARNPELGARLHEAGRGARDGAAALLAALGAERPREAAEALVAWTDGVLYDRLAGALAHTRPAPTREELRALADVMVRAALTV